MVSLIIDSREKELINLISDVNVEMLDLGDIVFRSNEREILLIIERKTISDLSASIIDGRLREQKARLTNTGIPKDRILYLIEGKIPENGKIGSLPIETVIGAIINTQFRDNLKVHRTFSVKESADYIIRILEKIKKDDKTLICSENKLSSADYAKTLKMKKSSNMTSRLWLITSLSVIPSLSTCIAEAIVNIYPTMESLSNALISTPVSIRHKFFEDIQIESTKKRRIGPVLSSKISDFFFGITEDK